MNTNPTDATVAALERDWPNWQVWTVRHTVDRRTTWCARRWNWEPGDTVLNADSAEHLVEYLADQAEQ